MELQESFVQDAQALIRAALSNYDESYGLGQMSCTVYDTAWVSMVSKTRDGKKEWLFPECFQFVLAAQSPDGGWPAGAAAQIDGILNTAAALLALKRYATEPLQLQDEVENLGDRCKKAAASLQKQLDVWDVSTTDHVGFEIIMPAMLDLLAEQDPSLVFEFDAKKSLLRIRDKRLSRFSPEMLYGPRRSTALHSLEAFVGKIEFDKVAHHAVQGSMMGSPSSTAAYLMHSPLWDDESEAYLRHVIASAAGRGDGSVPSAFPSTHFEVSWILSTLFRAGFLLSDLESPELTKMADILSHSFAEEDGVLGFAPQFEADVDDTAKGLTTLAMLGRHMSPDKMIAAFEANGHFKTYAGERNPSLTANCNALMAFLHQPDPSLYASQILKITTFICDYWWDSDHRIKDKWNMSYLYPSVLLVEALIDLLILIENDKLPGVFDQKSLSRMSIPLFQACFRTLLDQKEDGSWNDSIEETAYGLSILAEARRLRFFEQLYEPLATAIASATAFIQANRAQDASRIWIEKVSYASPLLTKSYVLAALRAAASVPGTPVGDCLWPDSAWEAIEKHFELFSQAKIFQSHPQWELRGSAVESSLYLPLLREHRLDVFQRQDVQEDKYFDAIPLFWSGPNNRARTYASAAFVYELSLIVILNFQVDEFIEAVAGPAFEGRMNDLRQVVHDVLSADRSTIAKNTNGVNGSSHLQSGDRHYDEVFHYFSKFTAYIFEHRWIKASTHRDQDALRYEIRTYLLAHIQQAEDCTRFRQSEEERQKTSVCKSTFFNWVRTTATDHVSCPYTWAFISCVAGGQLKPEEGGAEDCFLSAGEKYLSAALCRHLSTMARIYNDSGSVERDRDEFNLNSIDFPEFDPHASIAEKRDVLHSLGAYEHECQKDALRRLEELRASRGREGMRGAEMERLSGRRLNILSMFCDQVNLFCQIYVLRDLSSFVVQGTEPVAMS